MEESTTGKRMLEEDNDTVELTENDRKRFKTDLNQLSSSLENIRNEKDGKKWNILPSIVYELFALFKSGEKHNTGEKEKSESISDIKKDGEVLPNKDCQDKIFAENENLKEDHNGCDTISDANPLPNKELQKTLEIPKKSNESIVFKSPIEDIQNEKKLRISTNETGNIEKNIIKAVQTGNEINEKTNIFKNCVSSKSDHKDIVHNCILETKNNVTLPGKVNLLDFLNTLYVNGIKDIPITKPPPCVCKYCIYVDNLPLEQSVVQNQFTSNNQFDFQDKRLHSEMYSSNLLVSDCSICASKGIYTTNDCSCVYKSNSDYYSEQMPSNVGTSKDVWTNDLTNLMRKNEKIYKTNNNNYSKEKSVKSYIMKKVHKAAEHIKSRLPLCVVCNRSKFSNKLVCEYCDIPNHTNVNGYYRHNSDYGHIDINRRY